MKTAFFLLSILLFSYNNIAQAQTPLIRKIYRQEKRGNGTTKLFLPGWIVKFGVNLAKKELKKEEGELIKIVVKKLGNFRMLHIEDCQKNWQDKSKKIVKNAHKHHFNDLIMVRDKDVSVNVMAREKLKGKGKKRIVKNLLIMIMDGKEATFLSVKGRWDIKAILQHVKTLKNLNPKSLPIPLPKKPEEPAPQA